MAEEWTRAEDLMPVRELRELVLEHTSYVTRAELAQRKANRAIDPELKETEPTDPPTADVYFFGVEQAGELTAHELAEAIKPATHGWYQDVPIERLAQGPSYIELGAWIGDQGDALRLIGLGGLVGLWDVFTPEILGVTGKAAEDMAGAGYVLIMPNATTKAELA